MITIVFMNWARPANTIMNLHRYASYGLVKNVFCFNNGPQLLPSRPLPKKCVLIQSSENLGLYPRFAAASLATTEAIFHTDDDLIVPESTLEVLYHHWLGGQRSCHGLYGRIAHPCYQPGRVFGPVEVLLTRAVVCSRRVNNIALTASDLFSDLPGKPRGNGEDIILSFAAMWYSQSPNFAHCLPSEDYPSDDRFAIHKMWPDHLKHRQRVVSRCRQVFLGK